MNISIKKIIWFIMLILPCKNEESVNNIAVNFADFIHEFKNIPQHLGNNLTELGENIKDIFAAPSSDDPVGNLAGMYVKGYIKDYEKCENLGGKYVQGNNYQCRFPYSRTGCFGFCAYGTEISGGYYSQVLNYQMQNQVENNSNAQKILKESSILMIVPKYNEMSFSDSNGCVCHKYGIARSLTSKYNFGDDIFDTNLEDSNSMKSLVQILEQKTKNRKQ